MPVSKLNGTGKRILVIDDDLAIRVLLQAVLRRMNFDVELAEDGAAGLDKLSSNGRAFTACHELGHVMGLGHESQQVSCMYKYNYGTTRASTDDFNQLQINTYGPGVRT